MPGDYKAPPPPGTGADLLNRSHGRMELPPVHLTPPQREAAGKALVEMLAMQGTEVLALSMDAVHYHILARFRDGQVRPRVGRAKKHAYFRLRESWPFCKVWEALCGVKPIADRTHQLNVFQYIRDHAQKGAWTWTFREGIYWHPSAPE